ncbi:MAG: very short patch repair endonuclease [Rhodospirillales bacterium]|nr:very short patch repair endonuclease [Rhodospirillales bacterium]
MIVRKLLHAAGHRFRLHAKDLPGRPDIVFRGRKKVIFVHGCFWHRHPGCARATMPKTREQFWRAKFDANRRRDRQVTAALLQMGWKVMVVWECQARGDLALLSDQLKHFLSKAEEFDSRPLGCGSG